MAGAALIIGTVTMRFEIITIFPGFFAGIFEHGIVRRAQAEGLVAIGVHDLRAFTHDRHRTVDDRPVWRRRRDGAEAGTAGGGAGGAGSIGRRAESMSAVPTHRDETAMNGAQTPNETNGKNGTRVILLSAQGRPFTQAVARELAKTGARGADLRAL